MDLQLLIAIGALVGISVLAGALIRDVLFSFSARAWTDRWLGTPEDDEGWVEGLPEAVPGTAVAVREPRRYLPSVSAPPAAPARHRKGRPAPAYQRWLAEMDNRIADLDRRMGALS